MVHLLDVPVDLPLVYLDFFHPVVTLGALLAVLPALDHWLLLREAAIDLDLLHGRALRFANMIRCREVLRFREALRLLVIRCLVELLDGPILHQTAFVG